MTMRSGRGFCALCAAVVLVARGASLLAGEATKPEQTRPMRIGVIRVQDVFQEYQYAQDQEEKIKAEFDKEKNAIETLKKQIREKMERLKHDPLIRPGGRKWKLEMLEIKRLEIDLEHRQNKFQQDVRKRMAEFYRSIYQHFRAVVQKVGEDYQYDLIITAPSPDLSTEGEEQSADKPEAVRTEILLRRVQYIGKRRGVDITQFVLDSMNKRYAEMKKKNAVNPE